MHLKSIATASPSATYTQLECWEILQNSPQFMKLTDRSHRIAKKVLTGNSGIDQRHFAAPNIETIFDRSSQELSESFEKDAPSLCVEALMKASDRAKVLPEELDALFICTCTGYLCPGITSHVAETLNLPSNLFMQDIVGLGCGAAIPTIRSAGHFLSANPKAKIACIAVEICSSAFFMNNEPGVIISMCLFGDGAAAVILDGNEQNSLGKFSNFDSIHLPQFREKLRFVNDGGKLKNKLHLSVPIVAANAVESLWNRSQLSSSTSIISHSGGRDVLDSIEKQLQIPSLDEARTILQNNGNMSSPSVLFALEQNLNSTNKSTALWLTAFGAGFSAHSCQFHPVYN